MPGPVELKPIKTQDVIVPIIGIQSLICHAFSEQNIEAIESKQQKRATRAKPARDPDREAEASLYRTVEGAFGFPAIGFRQAMISACRYVDDLPMTVARGAFFVLGDASGMVKLELPEGATWQMRKDRVVIGRGTTSIAYRPEFLEWGARLRIRTNPDAISAEQIVNLVEIAGFAVGVGDWRPEKAGQHGMFSVDRGAIGG